MVSAGFQCQYNAKKKKKKMNIVDTQNGPDTKEKQNLILTVSC